MPHDDTPDDSADRARDAAPHDAGGVSRRDFLVRAGLSGVALSAVGPLIGPGLRAPSAAGGVGPAMAGVPDGGSAAPVPYTELYGGLRWRLLGPFRGGRVDAVSGVPGRPNEFYFGAVNGGVWKSIDAGRVWEPVFDGQPVASIGALAVAPSAPDVVYVGTGESTLRDSASYGNGVYRSSDAGRTWTHLGLDATQHIGKIAIHPTNPEIVFVAAIGHLYAPNTARGLFRSRDGGKTWERVLFRGENVGAVEVVLDPTNPDVVYAGLWNTRRPPWFTYRPSNGPGGGIFKSTDGGTTWTQLTTGLPPAGIGRTGIAVARTNPRRVYAIVDCLVPDPSAPLPPPDPRHPTAPRERPGQGGFFRSDDAGATWTRLSADPALWGRGWYFEKIAVDPKDADLVYVPNVAVNRTRDGGHTWDVIRGSPGGDDYHQIWIDPDDTNTMIVASDQGAIVTRNARTADAREVTWSSWLNQPTAQMYHIAVDYRFPYWVTGAEQDSGAIAVRSRGKFAEISMHDWEPIGAGGESGYTAGDPLHPGIVYGGTGGAYDLVNNLPVAGTTAPRVPPPDTARADWTQPLVFSKADAHALYYANQYLFRTTDGARSWTRVSPDLTRTAIVVPSTLDPASAALVDQNGKRGVIYTIAPSPLVAPMVWVGTDDGLMHLTTDGGRTWRDVTPRAVTPWSRVTMLEASHFDQRTAYASVDRHQLQDFDPYIYRTRDMGRTWQRITTGLPAGVYVHVVREDPRRQGLLFAGTERGAFVSFDDGDHWLPLQLNLPVTSVRDFQVYDGDLVVGTFGRGIWSIDDISPLRQIDAAVAASDLYLFRPADTVNMAITTDNGTPLQKDEPQAPNPPNGVAIDYYLRQAPTGPVTLEIVDASGAVVHTFTSALSAGRPTPARAPVSPTERELPRVSPLWIRTLAPFPATAGMHRVIWDAMKPPAAGSPVDDFGMRRGTPLTGTFTARLTVGGRSYTQRFTVRADPRVG